MKNVLGLLLPAVISLSIASCASRQSTGMNASTEPNPVVLSGNGTSVIPVDNINTNTTGNSLIRTSGTTTTAAAATAPGMATANSTGNYTMEMADADNAAIAKAKAREFMEQSAVISSSAITLSGLALKNGQRAEIKNFAAVVIKDHNALDTELQAMSRGKNMSIATSGTNLSAAVRDKAASLANTDTKQFDKTYVDLMVKDYKRTVALFEQGTKSTDPKVKAFAAKQLPALKLHLQQAVSLAKK
jgi:predicted outer membrane protein